jgi:hypothetical protein
MAAHLRVYPLPPDPQRDAPEPNVRVRLGDLLPLVAMAQKFRFIWLKDFLDDEVTITEDLYDVLQAFRSSRRPSA